VSTKLGSALGCIAVVAGLSACGGSAAGEGTSPTGTSVAAQAPKMRAETSPPAGRQQRTAAPGVKIAVRQSDYGRILVTGRGRTLYLFEKEKRAKTECYGACASAWPPQLTKGAPVAAAGIRQGLLGTTERRNGKRQVTYAGHPLYLYAPEDPGEILCQNVSEFGGLWLIVRPGGKPIR
jgi:predicted lipoprotein with Yx(FWY)xxD motif